jgi:hypothetical protein
VPDAANPDPAAEPAHRRAARHTWALLLARIYDRRKSLWDEVFPLVCPLCGGAMRIIAFITGGPTVRDILDHLGKPAAPPRIAPARGPPLGDLPDAGAGGFAPHARPAPEYDGVRVRSTHRLVTPTVHRPPRTTPGARVPALAARAIPARRRSPDTPIRGIHGPAANPDPPRFPSVRARQDVLPCSGRRGVALDLLPAIPTRHWTSCMAGRPVDMKAV